MKIENIEELKTLKDVVSKFNDSVDDFYESLEKLELDPSPIGYAESLHVVIVNDNPFIEKDWSFSWEEIFQSVQDDWGKGPDAEKLKQIRHKLDKFIERLSDCARF
jgi:hypothetical protein